MPFFSVSVLIGILEKYYKEKEQGTLRVIFGLSSEVSKFWSKYSLGHGLSIYSYIMFVSLIVFEIHGKKDDMQNYDVIKFNVNALNVNKIRFSNIQRNKLN